MNKKLSTLTFITFIALMSAFTLSSCQIFVKDEISPSLPNDIKKPEFKEVPVNFSHSPSLSADESNGLSYALGHVGSAVIDINGDGKFEVFIGGGAKRNDILLSYQNNQLIDIIKGTNLDSNSAATYGVTAIDFDNDGDTDLFAGREDSSVTYYENNGKGVFTPIELDINTTKNSAPMSIAIGDVDNDGDGDLYISNFANAVSLTAGTLSFENDPRKRRNILLRNDGNLKFTDVTTKELASNYGTFNAIFTDLNNDFKMDLVVAHNDGIYEIFQNTGNFTFKRIPLDVGFGFWMGIAIGDYDNDGDMDIFFPNSGGRIRNYLYNLLISLSYDDFPEDVQIQVEHLYLRNDGNFNFTEIKEAGYGFSWGGVFEDLNLDGNLDLLFAQNFDIGSLIGLDLAFLAQNPGKVLLGSKGNKFYPIDVASNLAFGNTPLIVDINNDGLQDIFWINMNGPAKLFVNTTKNSNNYVQLLLNDSVESLGAKITLITSLGKYHREITTSIGLNSDQTPVITFGLNSSEKPIEINVMWRDNEKLTIPNPDINRMLKIKKP